MGINELVELINQHDFYWRFSEDQRIWDRGWTENQKIKEGMREYLWDDIEPHLKEQWRKEAVLKLFS